MAKPKVLFPLQSPTLLNNLAQSNLWEVVYTELEPVDFQEKELIKVPRWDGEPVDLVVGCTEAHFRWFAERDSLSAYYHMIHSMDPSDMGNPPPGASIVGLQENGLELCKSRYHVSSTHLLSPAYEPKPVWKWAPMDPWSVMSRPKNRAPSIRERMAYLSRGIPPLKLFGQGQPHGFLSGPAREERMASSSCYVSMVGRESGFGLMEHEAMAAGIPVVARVWGDVRGLPGLARSDEELLELASKCCVDRSFAEYVSEAGLEYIRERRTKASLDYTVQRLLDHALARFFLD